LRSSLYICKFVYILFFYNLLLGQGDGRGNSLCLAGFKMVGTSAMRAILFSVVLLFLLVPPRAAIVAADAPPAAADAKHIEQLVNQLGSKDFAERERAKKEVIAVGAAALPRLQSAVKDRDLEIARRAKQCIEEIEINERVAALVVELKSPNPKIRAAAADKLTEMGSLAKPAVPALIQALDDPDKNVRIRVTITLGYIGPAAAAAVPRMAQLLNDRGADSIVRWMAARYLTYIGRPAESAVPALLRMLEEKDPGLRNGAAQALGALGHHHKDVVPALLHALNVAWSQKEGGVLSPIAASLGQIGKDPEHCVPPILQALKGVAGFSWGKDDPRPGLMYGLAYFGPAAKPAISTLVGIAGDEKETSPIRGRAIYALRRIGPDALGELRALQKSVRNSSVAFEISKAIKTIEDNASLGKKKNPNP
jgi:HEAT repeat protein